MDNFSKKENSDFGSKTAGSADEAVKSESAEEQNDELESIEFDDVDVANLQERIQKGIDSNPVFSPKEPEPIAQEPIEDVSGMKKYIVYVNPENIEFIDNLTLRDRKLIINDILSEQNAIYAKKKAQKKRRRFLAQLFTVCMTVVIGFPIMFFVVNKSMELTIGNYKEAQKNFEKLYRKSGKVQKPDMKKLDKYTY